jgi:hypothetical protein
MRPDYEERLATLEDFRDLCRIESSIAWEEDVREQLNKAIAATIRTYPDPGKGFWFLCGYLAEKFPGLEVPDTQPSAEDLDDVF